MAHTPSTVVCYVHTNPDTGEQTHFLPGDIMVVTLRSGGGCARGAATGGGDTQPGQACTTCGHTVHTCVTAEANADDDQTSS